MKNLADFIPLSWRYAEIACACIDFQNETFKSHHFQWTQWTQSCPIKINEMPMGNISIVYLEERPSADEGPFLKEEENYCKPLRNVSVRFLSESMRNRN